MLLAEDASSVSLNAAPGGLGLLQLDLSCASALEELMSELVASYVPLERQAQPFWWPSYGWAVDKFRKSQHQLAAANLSAASSLRRQLEQRIAEA